MKSISILLGLFICATCCNAQAPAGARPLVTISNGTLEGIDASGIRTFKGIPYAAPPIGNLRWREPQPVADWQGVRKADKFGPRAMQLPLFSDMMFRSDGMSEDCLYLNVWTPAKSAAERLPVLVYFYGGGFVGGDGSEYRYDGESMARRGIVAITLNYRLGVFGFLAHPELTKESPHHASGNYGLLDQSAALRWVQQNISAFGGDPARVTIAGESAGSFSVSAQMASPLSKNLIAGAIGESGSLLGGALMTTLAEAEKTGSTFAGQAGATSLNALRAMPAADLLEAAGKKGTPRFAMDIDGYFFPVSPAQIYTSGQQAHIPLLVGWNSEEGGSKSILRDEQPTKENLETAITKIYGEHGGEVSALYTGNNQVDVEQAATELASDRFIGFGTWKWSDVQSKTGGKPVYRYYYLRSRGAAKGTYSKMAPRGASHSAEIEYAMGNLATNKVFDWQPEDYKISETMQSYFANFIKTGNPNGKGLPTWPAINSSTPQVMYIDVNTRAEKDKNHDRYVSMDKLITK